MICDSHIHVGYYARHGKDVPFYYSPRRVVGVLNRAGVAEFIVSSTCAQMREIKINDIIREAREVKRLAGARARIFFWLSGHLYDEAPQMPWLDSGLFSGFKLHEDETAWIKKRRKDLSAILAVASARDMPIIFHCGLNDGCKAFELSAIARDFPSVRFCFAHCRPMDEMAKVMESCPNVWTDTAYMALDEFSHLRDYNWHGRLMFGTDLPVWQAHEKVGLDKRYSGYIEAMRAAGLECDTCEAFKHFTATCKDFAKSTRIGVSAPSRKTARINQ